MVEPASPRPGAARAADQGPGRRRRLVAVGLLMTGSLLVSACGSAPPDGARSAGSAVPGTSSTPGSAARSAESPAPAEPGEPASPASPTTDTAVVPATTQSEAAEPAARPIGTTMLDLVDPTRPTVSRGATTSSVRSLPTAVVYPAGVGGPWPLVVFAHGFRLGPPGYARLVAALVSAGYVVAAPSFPLADEGRAGATVDRGDLPNQPGDISFVIDQVLAAAADPVSPLAGRVDGSRLGAVGHSDGADTVLDLGYTAGRNDPRVRAIVALSPDAVVAAGSGVGSGTPLLLEHGDADDVVAYHESQSVFANVPAPRFFLTLLGAGHLQPVTEATAWTPILDATIVAFLDRYVAGAGDDEAAITEPARASAIARIEASG